MGAAHIPPSPDPTHLTGTEAPPCKAGQPSSSSSSRRRSSQHHPVTPSLPLLPSPRLQKEGAPAAGTSRDRVHLATEQNDKSLPPQAATAASTVDAKHEDMGYVWGSPHPFCLLQSQCTQVLLAASVPQWTWEHSLEVTSARLDPFLLSVLLPSVSWSHEAAPHRHTPSSLGTRTSKPAPV